MTTFQFPDPRQAALHQDLQKIGEWPAAAFRDACQIFAPDNPVATLETAAHLAVHLQREMKSALVSVLTPLDFKTPKDTDVDAVIAAVIKAADADAARLQDVRAALAPFDLKKASKGGDKAAIEAILRIFGLPADHELASLWIELGRLHARAHRNALAAPRRLEDVRNTWEIFQRVIALLLHRLDAAWSTVVYKRLDAIIATTQPGAAQLTDLRNKISNNPNTFRYFFDRATSDAWAQAITKDNSLFTNPPENGPWPAIQYLQTITPTHAEAVHRIVLQLPATPNVFTHMVLTQISGALPPNLAKDVIIREAQAIKQGDVADPFIAADLARHAAAIANTEAPSALAALRDLLQLRQGNDPVREVMSPLELHTYIDVANAARSISIHDAQATYTMLADTLDEALTLVHKTPGDDGSNGWMPAIEPHEQNHEYEPLPVLASAVRDAAESLLTLQPDKLNGLIAEAQAKGWFFFQRLALHLLRTQPDTRLAQEQAQRDDLLQNYALKHESHRFLQAVARHLTDEQRAELINRITSGPVIHHEDRFETPEQRQDYIEWWITQRLGWIKEWLTPSARERYDALVQAHHEPTEEDDFVAVIGTMWVGPTSPKTGDELMTMSIPDILVFLRTWQPGKRGAFEHSREGVAGELQTLATERATDIAVAARGMKDLDPTYLRGILNGLQSAVQNKHAILDWDSIVELAAHVVAQPRDIPGRTDDGWNDDDPHWGWTRAAVARVFEAGFRPGDATIPIKHRERIFPILTQALDDPDPIPEDEDERDPMNVALNSTRGQALRAIILYALWVRRTNKENRTFDDMPEVRDVLTRTAAIEQSPGVRAVFGELLPIVAGLDPVWLRENRDQLFTPDALGDAIFHTYITYGQATHAIDKLLMPQFDRAVEALGAQQKAPAHYPDHLARHVMWLYSAGDAALDDGGLVDRFMRNATPEDRSYAIGFAPTAARDCSAEDHDRFREKLKTLWEWCVKRTDLTPMQHGIGHWFSEEQLDLAWRLEQLETALTIAHGVARDFEIMDDLAEATPSEPARVLRCAQLLFDTGEYFRRYHWVHEGSVRRIITEATATTDHDVIAQAKAFANHLIGQGFDEFLDLAS
jgi:hypothetical protein